MGEVVEDAMFLLILACGGNNAADFVRTTSIRATFLPHHGGFTMIFEGCRLNMGRMNGHFGIRIAQTKSLASSTIDTIGRDTFGNSSSGSSHLLLRGVLEGLSQRIGKEGGLFFETKKIFPICMMFHSFDPPSR